MDLNEYQQGARSFDNCDHLGLAYYGLGIAGEAGETADKVKKVLREEDLSDERREALKLEIGDVMWYCATLAHHLGFTLDEVGQANIDKLTSRVQRGVLYGSGDHR